MGRPAQRFEDLPATWQKWLKRIADADKKWRRAEKRRKDAVDRLKRETGRSESTVREMPEYEDLWKRAETLRIERAELFLASTERGVTMYRIAKHLGYGSQRPVAAAIESLKGERVDYRRPA